MFKNGQSEELKGTESAETEAELKGTESAETEGDHRGTQSAERRSMYKFCSASIEVPSQACASSARPPVKYPLRNRGGKL